MEVESVSSSPMQLGARRGVALTAQKARANARAALGSEIVKFAVMDDVAIVFPYKCEGHPSLHGDPHLAVRSAHSITKNAAVVGLEFWGLGIGD